MSVVQMLKLHLSFMKASVDVVLLMQKAMHVASCFCQRNDNNVVSVGRMLISILSVLVEALEMSCAEALAPWVWYFCLFLHAFLPLPPLVSV